MSAEGIFTSGIIKTPAGDYVPVSDILINELKAAARFAGLVHFKAFVNGERIMSFESMPSNTISGLRDIPRIEGVEPSVVIEKYDRAG